jgi:hypothetical protein
LPGNGAATPPARTSPAPRGRKRARPAVHGTEGAQRANVVPPRPQVPGTPPAGACVHQERTRKPAYPVERRVTAMLGKERDARRSISHQASHAACAQVFCQTRYFAGQSCRKPPAASAVASEAVRRSSFPRYALPGRRGASQAYLAGINQRPFHQPAVPTVAGKPAAAPSRLFSRANACNIINLIH